MTEKNQLFHGSLVALITPMKDDGQLDLERLKQLIDWHIDSGTSGLVIMGTTGESATVLESEHVEVSKVAIDHAAGRISIILGCGSSSTQRVKSLVHSLNALKPDAFLCVTPYYVKALQEGLFQHFTEVADVCEAPLLLYNVPSRTACDLHNDTIIKLAQNSNIVGIKDAVGDLARSKILIDEIGQDFCVLSGDDPTAFEFMQQGGVGIITVTGNVAPKQMSQWCNGVLAGELVESKKIFDRLMPLHDAMFVESNPMPAKWALSKLGRIDSGIRLPLTLPSSSAKIVIEKAMNECGIVDILE